MKHYRASIHVRFLAIFSILGVLGIGAVVYILIHERLVLPFRNVYDVRAEFSAADGVVAGTGQPVLVAGVKVGQITGVGLSGGNAIATMQLNRSQVPRVYANATATLVPITPLGDMSLDLAPGGPPSGPLPARTAIGVGQSSSPVNVSELLGSLDTDTRDYLTTLLSSLAQGVGDRGADLRRTLIALGPTIGQVGQISSSLAARRTELAQFVHNLGVVAHAASQDGQIPTLISAGNTTLKAITSQDQALRQSLADLPGILNRTNDTLTALRPFADLLGPTLSALTPAVHRLPTVLGDTQAFSQLAIPALRNTIRPLIQRAIPFFATLAPAVEDLNRATPNMLGVAQSFNYFLNELGYVPGGGDQGFLFWLAWSFHNLDSVLSSGDANGTIGRSMIMLSCNGVQDSTALIRDLSGLVGLCQK
jgi:phospholipid/cholesterol/gamma-HCH transport system substrate-binding protein